MPVLQIAKETVGVVGLAPRERVQQRTADAPMPQVLEETVEAVRVVQRESMQQQTVYATTPEVLEETVEVGRLVLHERVQQQAAEQIEDAPPSPEETVETVRSVSHERVQRAAEQTGDLPQSPEKTVEILRPRSQDKNVLPERVSERISEQGGVIEVSESASQDRRLQRAVVQYLDVSAEVDKNVFQERFSVRMRDRINREHLQCYFKVWGLGCMLRCTDRVLAALR